LFIISCHFEKCSVVIEFLTNVCVENWLVTFTSSPKYIIFSSFTQQQRTKQSVIIHKREVCLCKCVGDVVSFWIKKKGGWMNRRNKYPIREWFPSLYELVLQRTQRHEHPDLLLHHLHNASSKNRTKQSNIRQESNRKSSVKEKKNKRIQFEMNENCDIWKEKQELKIKSEWVCEWFWVRVNVDMKVWSMKEIEKNIR
jgi:hypothetical protein